MATAKKEYNKASGKVRGLIDEIIKLLEDHEVDQSRQFKDWGYVGDLAHVSEELENIKNFLSDK